MSAAVESGDVYHVWYRDSVLDDDGEQCNTHCIMRYSYDRNNWIEVTVGSRGIEIRSNGGQMVVQPIAGNNIEVYQRERR